ncbi:uncharacterized protein EI90DRAFT_3120204 [Cantharellus anzutake]|uniref:uncharacterized protein n=1 Tax=Cantharellus anzutake TaxID=1750568 RepID=UPI001906A51F|nr:uncharacterized protein EI90DRAFT_3120204 [Cantharellus anzutake]KAF8335968.1 hypothetical protein EI90DRAFT_3120204 [Cantharellus anzutake]
MNIIYLTNGSSGYFMLPNNGIPSTPTPTNYHQSVGRPMYIQNSLMTSGAPSQAQSFGYEVSSFHSVDQGLTNAHGQDVVPAHYAAHHGPSHSKELLVELIETLVQQKVEETLAQHLDKTNEKVEEGAVDNGTHQNKTRKGKWPPKGQEMVHQLLCDVIGCSVMKPKAADLPSLSSSTTPWPCREDGMPILIPKWLSGPKTAENLKVLEEVVSVRDQIKTKDLSPWQRASASVTQARSAVPSYTSVP